MKEKIKTVKRQISHNVPARNQSILIRKSADGLAQADLIRSSGLEQWKQIKQYLSVYVCTSNEIFLLKRV